MFTYSFCWEETCPLTLQQCISISVLKSFLAPGIFQCIDWHSRHMVSSSPMAPKNRQLIDLLLQKDLSGSQIQARGWKHTNFKATASLFSLESRSPLVTTFDKANSYWRRQIFQPQARTFIPTHRLSDSGPGQNWKNIKDWSSLDLNSPQLKKTSQKRLNELGFLQEGVKTTLLFRYI